jgi:His-Xaa-Ser system radical SAM maturase HxsB
MSHTIPVQLPELDLDKLGPFRFGRIDGQVLLTSDVGEYHWLTEEDFAHFLAGRLDAEHPEFAGLQEKGFVRVQMDLDAMSRKLARKRAFLGMGPHLHVMITTLRCNQSCSYCHASRTDMDRVDTDMSLATAKQAVDFAMKSPNPYLNFEFQGGEPTVNFDVIQFVVEYSREKNRQENKQLTHSLVTNMTYMTEAHAEWLVDHDVLVCTSLDGPEDLHNANRGWKKGGSAYADVLKWMKHFNKLWVDRGRDPDLWHVDALMTTTRKSLDRYKEIIDLYVSLGIRNIHLRPLNPFGFATKTWKAIGYSHDEYRVFYDKALDYILELNRQGVQIQEGTASTFLMKMLTPDDPNFVDIRSPVGSGTGQLAYSYDGSILPSDEGRMIQAMGDDLFVLGNVATHSYEEIANHPTLKTLAVASLLDTLPQCHSCWNAPYCGVRPLHNYMMNGDLFAQRPNTFKCHEHMSISTLLLRKLRDDESGEVERAFRRWTLSRARDPSESVY